MSSIMRARSALTGRAEGWEVIGGSSLELKVAGPSMLGIGCPGRHALPLTPPQKAPRVTRAPIPRERVRSWVDSGPSAAASHIRPEVRDAAGSGDGNSEALRRFPYPPMIVRHLCVRQAEMGERVIDRIGEGGDAAHIRRLADT